MDALIQNPAYSPSFEEITNYMSTPARSLWLELTAFIENRYKSSPKIMYSTCSAKPGWNVKYRKSSKAICTLYPEQDCFVALVVVSLKLVPLLTKEEVGLHPYILEMIKNPKPFNGTLWLMITVMDKPVLDSLKNLLVLARA